MRNGGKKEIEETKKNENVIYFLKVKINYKASFQ